VNFNGGPTLVATTTFAFWHEYCGWVKATFSFLVISKSYALQKDHTFQLLRLTPDLTFASHGQAEKFKGSKNTSNLSTKTISRDPSYTSPKMISTSPICIACHSKHRHCGCGRVFEARSRDRHVGRGNGLIAPGLKITHPSNSRQGDLKSTEASAGGTALRAALYRASGLVPWPKAAALTCRPAGPLTEVNLPRQQRAWHGRL
jgi:hypothetical protein